MAQDTICALSSGAGKAGVAVIRVSGPRVRFVLETMCGGVPAERYASVRGLIGGSGFLIDQAIVLFFAAPRSLTGEDLCEFQVHGGKAVVAAVLGRVLDVPGCRLAEAGEFVQRAFEAGKYDLVEIEGLAELIDSETEEQRKAALRQARGVFSGVYSDWRVRILRLRALAESDIDFSDEGDVSDDHSILVRNESRQLFVSLRDHMRAAVRGDALRDGVVVAVVGAPNAGKSTLVNWLAGRDVAIVHETAGTTRDVIELRLDLGGFVCVVLDTAGIRHTEDAVEAEGIARSRAAIGRADLILELIDSKTLHSGVADDVVENCGDGRVATRWRVASRTDLAIGSEEMNADFAISVRTGSGLDDLLVAMESFVRLRVGETADTVMLQSRQKVHMKVAMDAMGRIVDNEGLCGELVAEELRVASEGLGFLTGELRDEDVLSEIFSSFCIGK